MVKVIKLIKSKHKETWGRSQISMDCSLFILKYSHDEFTQLQWL